ncbi:hypothetical protein H0I76_04475 [Limibaculum sp. M0105]|uniref:Uncharacterized protein n=1 Tax=Thermohalobaculum xanthum TaxID=2753746 RepID=A0A8J7M4X6_9RHOB|nr:hypothetical protein [Thermohalobaculum xanthum]MBK0398434.1 hypothetical protein [Thermohalobaculum xanthum]
MLLQVLESGVLVVVSLIWYGSLWGVIARRKATPVRPAIVTLICAGLLVGIASKLSEFAGGAPLDPLVWLHVFNLMVVFADLGVTARYVRGAHDLRALLRSTDGAQAV